MYNNCCVFCQNSITKGVSLVCHGPLKRGLPYHNSNRSSFCIRGCVWDKTNTQMGLGCIHTPRGCTPLTKALGAQPVVYTLYIPPSICAMVQYQCHITIEFFMIGQSDAFLSDYLTDLKLEQNVMV